MGAVVCAAVVGPGNNPLYVKALAPVEDEVKFHYMVHASLDAVEEKVLLRRSPGEVPELYLGLLFPTEEYRVYGYITNSHTKFILVLSSAQDDGGVPREDALRATFRRLHALYVDAVACNPLYTVGAPIASRRFDAGAAAILRSYSSSVAA